MISRAFPGFGIIETPLLQQKPWLLRQRMHNTLCLHTRTHLFHLSQLDPRAPLFSFVLPYPWECIYPMPWTSMSEKGHCHHHYSTVFVRALPGAELCQLPNADDRSFGVFLIRLQPVGHCHPHGASDNRTTLGFKA